MSEIIPLSVPSIQGNEWKYVKECLDTGWVSSAGKNKKMLHNYEAFRNIDKFKLNIYSVYGKIYDASFY